MADTLNAKQLTRASILMRPGGASFLVTFIFLESIKQLKVLDHFGGVKRLEAFEDSKSEVSFVYFCLLGFFFFFFNFGRRKSSEQVGEHLHTDTQ
jgi:hypothetical protein